MKYDSVQKAEQVYSALEEPRRTLIRPVWLPDDQYAEEWLKRDYDRKGFSVKSKFVCKFLWVLVNRVYGSMLQEEELSKDTKPPREFPLQPLVIRASSGCKYIPLLSGHLLKKI